MATSGGTPRGASITREFPFTFDTSGILTGAALYTPTVGDILHDAWIEIDTAWNGTTPLGDFGTFAGVNFGLFSGCFNAIDMTGADDETDGGLLNQGGGSGTRYASLVSTLQVWAGGPPATDFGVRIVPAKFTTTDPIKIVVSQDGTNTGADPGATTPAHVTGDTPPTSPLVVVHNVNDNFVFTGDGGAGAPETFELAAGTYTGIAAIIAAMGAAVGSAHGEAFSTLVTPSNSAGSIELTMVGNAGSGDNENTITAGSHDVSASLGFTGNPDTFVGGTGTPLTQGAGILYLVTATPV